MKQVTYYTVITYNHFCLVKYATGPAYEVLTFSGTFDDPGEASQEIKKTLQGPLEFQTPALFQRKIDDLHTRYKQDRAKLADWNTGKAIRI